jgi:hypothetical protein
MFALENKTNTPALVYNLKEPLPILPFVCHTTLHDFLAFLKKHLAIFLEKFIYKLLFNY